jgi:glycosyltransferase involved in cell wall biosynthesis
MRTSSAVQALPSETSTSEGPNDLELSVVMPCLNEADTVAICVEKAVRALREAGIVGEVILADNGSSDGSQKLASDQGARVVPVSSRGYGAALMGGIEAARGKFVIMGDADDSYDFLEIPAFVAQLRKGYDLVQGCRLPSGGGRVLPGAMPITHRWIGNPMFSFLARRWFRAPIHDVYCGLRGFTKLHYEGLQQRCTGMEFATEMIIKSSLHGAKIGEVPITLHPDGRKNHPPHLRTVRDGWRTLRFFLMCCPRWLFVVPGLTLMLLGLVACALALPAIHIGSVIFDVHTLLYGSVAVLCGYQSILFAIFTTTFGVNEGIRPATPGYRTFYRFLNLERGLLLGALAGFAGLAMLVMPLLTWQAASFGRLDYPQTLRWAIPGAVLLALGFQTVSASFFVSILGMQRRSQP